MLLTLSGNEKAGKTTLARRIVDSRPKGLHVVHASLRWFEGYKPSIYVGLLELATRADTLVILDRSWAEGPFYDDLLGRPRAWDPVEGEWCLSLPASAFGVLAVLPNQLAERDETDWPIDPHVESEAWRSFAEFRPWWQVWERPPDPKDVVAYVREQFAKRVAEPPVYSGSRRPRILLVGQERNVGSRDPMAWAPLSTRLTRRLAHEIPPDVWPHLGLTNAVDIVNHKDLGRLAAHHVELIVVLGQQAAEILASAGYHYDLVMPHPAAVYRWGRYQAELNGQYRPMAEAMLQAVEGPKMEETADVKTY